MSSRAPDGRHQTPLNLGEIWASGHPQVLPLTGHPWCEIRIDPQTRRASLVTEFHPPEPDVSKLRRIALSSYVKDDRDLVEIEVSVDGNLQAAYGLLTSIADGLQIEGLGLSQSVSDSVARYKDVLSAVQGLSESSEIGLFGELLFLEFLVRSVGRGPAMRAWHGPDAEEHDFALGAIAVEVKTTSLERRKHRIATLSQLEPLPGTPLFLLSVQITRGNSSDSCSLPELIGRVRSAMGDDVSRLEERLSSQGWTADHDELHQTRWRLRSAPRAYAVTRTFPSLTSAALQQAVDLSLVSDVTYSIDVTFVDPSTLPEPYGAFCTDKDFRNE